MAPRLKVWEKLAGDWKPTHLESVVEETTLETLEPKFHAILKGQVKGRVLVKL
jgi:hypothetical protein